MKDWCESDLSGSYPRRKELQRTREVGQESEEKEVKQECGIKPSCTEGDFGPIPWGALGHHRVVESGQESWDIDLFILPVLEGTYISRHFLFGGMVLAEWSDSSLGLSSKKGYEGTRMDKGKGNEMVRHGAHAGHRSGELGRGRLRKDCF